MACLKFLNQWTNADPDVLEVVDTEGNSRRRSISWVLETLSLALSKGDGPAASVDHYDFGFAGFNADEARAKLKARSLKFADSNSQESFKFRDPDGFQIQLNAPDYRASGDLCPLNGTAAKRRQNRESAHSPIYSAFREAISIEKRYFTSALCSLS